MFVSSPGPGSEPEHWSRPFTATMAAMATAAGATVLWLEPARAATAAADVPPGVAHRRVPFAEGGAVHRVAAGNRHLAVELELTRELRARPTAVVVHVGVGARGSPNVGWLAERLGSRSFAVARGAEVVCHRGDLRFRDGTSCAVVDDAARCRRCCAAGLFRRPHADDFRNRGDLLVASLQAAAAVFVPERGDADRLRAFGLNGVVFVEAGDPAAIVARLGQG
ncbi:MAG: hypothetical protein JNK15_13580 [Planctomycetes bacterium]|nr:hypothetical protein [Planctomycetota bacterium]